MSLLSTQLNHLRRHIAQLTSTGHAAATSAPDLTDPERGDVPGWVLVTLMTAGLVTLLWQTAGPLLTSMFTNAMQQVSG